MLLRRRCSLFLQFCKSETEGESKRKKLSRYWGEERRGKASFVELIIFIYQKSAELRGTEIQRSGKETLTVLPQHEHQILYRFQWRLHHYEDREIYCTVGYHFW
jgi:hypothetical protein